MPAESATRNLIDDLLAAVLDMDEVERAAYLERHCTNPAAGAEVIALCRADAAQGGSLDTPLEDLAIPLLGADIERESSREGHRIGAYRVIALLGEGGMASVWRAERCDGAFAQSVAIKCLKRALLTADLQRRFERERQILADLVHPHIAHLLDGGVSDDGVPYIVMEFVDGESLVAWCRNRSTSLRTRLQLFLKVLGAVQYAHQHLVVHRDLKPGNILVNHDGYPRLLDFGVAALLDETATETPASRGVALTPEYAAPEQMHGRASGTAVDIYALGVILCELLAGRRPPSAPASMSRPSQLALQHPRLAKAPRLRRARALRGDLDAIVGKAMRTDPAARYATAAEMAADIARHLARQPVQARRGALAYRSLRFVQRHAAGLAAAVVVAAVLVVATAHGFHQVRQTRSALLQSETVRGFLVDLFESNKPSTDRSELPSTRDLLDRGATRARDEFTDSPELQADMLNTIGGIYRRLGLYAEARSLLQRARDVERNHDLETATALDTRWELALLDLDQGHLKEAARALHDILDARRLESADTGLLVAAMRDVARAESRLGHHAQAISLQREVLQMLSVNTGDPIEIAQAHNDLGAAMMRDGQTAKAAEEYRAALGPIRAKLGPVHERVTQTQSNLAAALRRLGRYDEAETLLREAVASDLRIYSGAHPDAAQHLNNLGTLLYFRDRAIEAGEVLTRAHAMYQAVFGDAHSDTAMAASNLALVQIRLGRYDDAVALQRAVLDVFEKTYGKRHYSVAVAQNNLARSLVETGVLDEARELGMRSLALKRELRGENDQSLAPALATLALADERGGDYPAALQRYAQIQQLPGLPDPAFDGGTLAHRVGRGRVLCLSGQAEQGLADFDFALSQAPLAAAEAPLKRAEALVDEGDCLQSVGRIDAARDAWQQALALRDGRVPEDFPGNRRLLTKIDAAAATAGNP